VHAGEPNGIALLFINLPDFCEVPINMKLLATGDEFDIPPVVLVQLERALGFSRRRVRGYEIADRWGGEPQLGGIYPWCSRDCPLPSCEHPPIIGQTRRSTREGRPATIVGAVPQAPGENYQPGRAVARIRPCGGLAT
jgi:hypothetical protein